MRIHKGILLGVLLCLLILVTAWSVDHVRAETLTGEAWVTFHPYKMLKGQIYRIMATGDGFMPQVRVQGQTSGTFTDPTPPVGNVAGKVAKIFFVPAETKVYQIKVDPAAGTEIGKAGNTYTLTIERAVFKPFVAAQERHVELGEHMKTLEQGKVYGVTVTGKGFAPELQVLDGARPVARAISGRWFGFGPDAEFVTSLTLTPARTTEYRMAVTVGPTVDQRTAPLTYTMRVVELKVQLTLREQLTKQDPIYPRRGGPHKVHRVKLEAGKTYQIDMMSKTFDTYLFLESPAGKVLLQDDDGGEGLNARMIFRPAKTDTYTIVATTFRAGAGIGLGLYELTVMENPHAQPKFATPAPAGKYVTEFPK